MNTKASIITLERLLMRSIIALPWRYLFVAAFTVVSMIYGPTLSFRYDDGYEFGVNRYAPSYNETRLKRLFVALAVALFTLPVVFIAPLFAPAGLYLAGLFALMSTFAGLGVFQQLEINRLGEA